MDDGDLLDPSRLMELDLSPERLRAVAEVFEAIRQGTERRGASEVRDRRDGRPAVVRRPVHEMADD